MAVKIVQLMSQKYPNLYMKSVNRLKILLESFSWEINVVHMHQVLCIAVEKFVHVFDPHTCCLLLQECQV